MVLRKSARQDRSCLSLCRNVLQKNFPVFSFFQKIINRNLFSINVHFLFHCLIFHKIVLSDNGINTSKIRYWKQKMQHQRYILHCTFHFKNFMFFLNFRIMIESNFEILAVVAIFLFLHASFIFIFSAPSNSFR